MTPSDTNGLPFRTWFPIMYHYRLNNTGAWKRDGGVAQATANGDTYASIPTSGSTNYSNRYIIDEVEIPGYAWHAPWGFHWAGVGPRAWPQVNNNVFYDPNDNCRPWLVWTWAQRSGYSWDTNNVAAYPLLGGLHSSAGFRLADALYQNPTFAPPNNTQPLQLFYAYDPSTLYFGNIPNGKVMANLGSNAPELSPDGVAEGGTVFTRTADNGVAWTYAMATRNAWNQPSYQLVYRRASSIEALHLPWGGVPAGPNERVLLASNWIQKWDGTRDSQSRTNFGSAQYFHAYGYDYILFHKLPNTANPIGTPRQLFITNLYFSYDGLLYRLYDYFPDPFGHYRDANWYFAPSVLGLSTPPVP
jgi:hypothetical protein